ncbi:MAG: amidohydrolase family protein, partial [Muribaculaceae bacterium]|nr:amidohydrolase family protein [Muribaculaceae bacterium]
MDDNLIIINANLFTPVGNAAARGEEMGHLLHIPNAIIVITHGKFLYAGDGELMPAIIPSAFEVIDAKGNAVIPGFVDSHTHLIFGGYRPDEFGWRLKG